jgi:hypothetical protein
LDESATPPLHEDLKSRVHFQVLDGAVWVGDN